MQIHVNYSFPGAQPHRVMAWKNCGYLGRGQRPRAPGNPWAMDGLGKPGQRDQIKLQTQASDNLKKAISAQDLVVDGTVDAMAA